MQATTDAAGQDLQLGGSVQLGTTFIMASAALAHLELLEAASILVGFVDAHFPSIPLGPEWQAFFAATDQILLDTLGTTRAEELRAHGATLSNGEALAYLRDQRDRALAADHNQLTRDRDIRAVGGV